MRIAFKEWAIVVDALAVRVFRLPRALEGPMLPAYGGCKSWCEIEDNVPTAGSQTVLDDAQFALKLARFGETIASVSARD